MAHHETQPKTAPPSAPLSGHAGLLQRTCACGQHTVAGGECEACRRQHEGIVQRTTISSSSAPGAPRSPGQPRDASGQGQLQPRFGHDFTRVPVAATPAPRPSPAEADRSGDPLPFLDTIQRSFGRHDLSHVRAHTDRAAAARALAIGADAFTRGADVTFSRMPVLHTAAHEAAHVIQQRAGSVAESVGQAGDAHERHADAVADRVVRGQSSEDLLDAVAGPARARRGGLPGPLPAPQSVAPAQPAIQMRRIPPNIRALLTAASGGNGPNFAANAEGSLILINRAMAELTHAERVSVLQRRRGALTEDQFNALPRRERRIRTVDAILALFPSRELGDPNLIDTGPRPATADAANITTVVTNTNNIFTSIASGARDAWLTDVFGAANIAMAKTKYANGRTALNALHAAGRILTDRSGYAREVFQGGLTDPPGSANQAIRVATSVIDSPNAHGSITTLLHESLHAGNTDVSDDVYITATGFTTQTEAQKLRNSAHFEVVPWRILDPASPHAFAVTPPTTPPTFQRFVPAGTTIGGVTAPARTRAEEGAIAAYDLLREAWTIGLNLHLLYLQLFRTPTDWTVPQPEFGGDRFDNSLPYWSKVQKLTIHLKTTINPASPNEAERPVSQIDMALSEGLTRKLGIGMFVLEPLHTQAQILAFEAANSTSAERSAAFPGGAHTNADVERDFLLRLAVRHSRVGPLTGSQSRDLRVVRELGLLNWGTVLNPRNPASFPD